MSAGQHTPQRPGRLARLADLAFRRRRLVLLAWIVALAAAFAASGALAGQFSADYATPGSESQRAGDLLAERFPARSSDTVDVVWEAKAGGEERGGAAADRRAARPPPTHLEGHRRRAAPPEISRDGTIAVSRLPLTERPDSVPVTTGESLISLGRAASQDGLRVEMGGQVITNAQTSAMSSEAVGLVIAALVLRAHLRLARGRRACRSRPRCSASASPPPPSACSPRSSTCPTGRPRSRHDRPRRRHRLRAADRHPLPRRARDGARAARRRRRGGRDRRPLRADRRAPRS